MTSVENRGNGRAKIFSGCISTEGFEDVALATSILQGVVTDYLELAGKEMRGKKSVFKRPRPLIALPMPGVGQTDVSDLISDDSFMLWMLPELYQAANRFGVDVALCTTDKRAFYVMNVLRTRCCPFVGGPFWMLTDEHRKQIEHLQGLVSTGRLALLFGAGVSLPSGLPSWSELLEQLAKEAGFTDQEYLELNELHYLDQPTLIEERVGGRPQLTSLIIKILDAGRYTPAHAMLGAMKLPAVTTNYDDLYEAAVASCVDDNANHEEVLRLPWDAGRLASRPIDAPRLVKLHGCVSNPKSIVRC